MTGKVPVVRVSVKYSRGTAAPQQMPSTAEKVEHYLEGDLVIERALARGVLSLRRTSRWLIEHRDWDVSEDAVVSALRRHTPRPVDADVDEGYALLREARTGVGTGLALATVPALAAVRRRVREALGEHASPLAVLPGSDTTTYVVDDSVVDRLDERDGLDVHRLVRPLSQVRVAFPDEDPACGVALSILLNTFSHRGIPVLEAFSCRSEYSLLVRDAHTSQAHDVLLHLRGELGDA